MQNYFQKQGKIVLFSCLSALFLIVILPILSARSAYIFLTPCSGCSTVSFAAWLSAFISLILLYLIGACSYLLILNRQTTSQEIQETDEKNFFYLIGKFTHAASLYLAGFFGLLAIILIICLLVL